MKGDIVLVWCYRGYRPGLVKEKGKRKTKVSWANGDTEWIENKRIRKPTNLKDRCWMEQSYKEEGRKMNICPRCGNPIDVAIHFGQKFCRNCGCRLDHPKEVKIKSLENKLLIYGR